MKELARICYRYWLEQTNVLFIIGGKANNTDIFETFRAMGDALREHFAAPRPDAVVCRRRARRAQPHPGYGVAARHLRDAADPLQDVRLRLRHERGHQLRAHRGRVDEAVGREPRSPEPRTTSPADGVDRWTRRKKGETRCTRRGSATSSSSSASARWPRSPRVTTGCACSTSSAGSPRDVTPVSHEYSGGNVVFGTSPGAGGRGAGDRRRRHPGLQQRAQRASRDGHTFNCGVVYLPPSAAAPRCRRADPGQPGPGEGLHRHREDLGARRPRDPGHGPVQRDRHLRRQQSRRRRLVEPRADRRSARRQHARGGPAQGVDRHPVQLRATSPRRSRPTCGWPGGAPRPSSPAARTSTSTTRPPSSPSPSPTTCAARPRCSTWSREATTSTTPSSPSRWSPASSGGGRARLTRAVGHAGAMSGGGDDAESKERWFMDEVRRRRALHPGAPRPLGTGVRSSPTSRTSRRRSLPS